MGARGRAAPRRATEVDTEAEVAPWETETETENERQARYKREAEEMKLKWDARRLEEKQSAERRIAFAAKEKERVMVYGKRDLVMEAYEARMYEEARVLEVCRKQREVYERTKAFKLGRPLPPKGEPYVKLRPVVPTPPKAEDFDLSGHYYPQEDVVAAQYRAPASFVSPTGPAPPPLSKRGAPRAAWEEYPYGPPPASARDRAEPPALGSVTELPKAVIEARALPDTGPTKDELPKLADLDWLKVAELKRACATAGLDVSGTKQDLHDRLERAILRTM